jgi:hypothetical protein
MARRHRNGKELTFRPNAPGTKGPGQWVRKIGGKRVFFGPGTNADDQDSYELALAKLRARQQTHHRAKLHVRFRQVLSETREMEGLARAWQRGELGEESLPTLDDIRAEAGKFRERGMTKFAEGTDSNAEATSGPVARTARINGFDRSSPRGQRAGADTSGQRRQAARPVRPLRATPAVAERRRRRQRRARQSRRGRSKELEAGTG